MHYDFDRSLDRRDTGSVKWHAPIIGGDDILPLWVADMDLPCPAPVTDALRSRLDHPLFGYTLPTDAQKETVIRWISSRYGWDVRPEWLVFAPGVMPSIEVCIKGFLSPGDAVVVQPPVYPPFFDVAGNNGCMTEMNPLMPGSRYTMDYDDLARRFPEDGRTRILLLSSPHNPVGRVWTADELRLAAEPVIRAGGYIISDEIHADIILDGRRHVPVASLAPEIAARTVTCLSPSKTFNLPGLQTSVMVIPDAGLRDKMARARGHLFEGPNALGLTAMEAAYRYGGEWLEQALAYISGNLEFLTGYINGHIPGCRVVTPEGTYLVWLDFTERGLSDTALKTLLTGKARVFLNDGPSFGPGGSGFMRINIACPRSLLTEALNRIARTVSC